MCDLEAALLNVLRCLIWELMIYEFKLDHYVAAEATKNTYAKSEGTIDKYI